MPCVQRTVQPPTQYGHIGEVGLDKAGRPWARKWYTLGRLMHELATCMPDRKTCYVIEDAANAAIIKFVADRPGDLSSGTLYSSKMPVQTSAANGGAWDVTWVKLGSATQAQLERAVASKFKFSDVFETIEGNSATGACPTGFKATWLPNNFGFECLKLKTGMETHAAFFETRRYSAYMGATHEASRFEGAALDSRNKVRCLDHWDIGSWKFISCAWRLISSAGL